MQWRKIKSVIGDKPRRSNSKVQKPDKSLTKCSKLFDKIKTPGMLFTFRRIHVYKTYVHLKTDWQKVFQTIKFWIFQKNLLLHKGS